MSKARAKVIKKSVGSTEDVKDLNSMFNQITGLSDADPEVIFPKLDKIYKNIQEYYKLYKILLDFEVFTKEFNEYNNWFDDISVFLKELISSTGVKLDTKYGPGEKQDYHTLDDVSLNTLYKQIKNNAFVKQIIITSSNLSAYKKNLTSDPIDDIFIKREPGLILQPLAFSSLDLKVIWMSSTNDKAKKFILSILKHTYTIGIDTYDILTSPDVDIKKFSRLLIDNIAKMKKRIPRCDKAFGIIENSVKLLETNFKNYFRTSIEAENPSLIIESFVVDISTSQKVSPVVTAEFRKIIGFLKEQNSQSNDPKIKKLFSMLNNQFSSTDMDLNAKDEPLDSDQNNDTSLNADVADMSLNN
jgi:hypothetical protein